MPNDELRQDISRLEADLAATERRLAGKRAELARIESACSHQWGPIVTSTRVGHKEEIDWGRPPDKHGVHLDYHTRRHEVSVPVYTRTCRLCGRIEATEHTSTHTVQGPDFGRK